MWKGEQIGGAAKENRRQGDTKPASSPIFLSLFFAPLPYSEFLYPLSGTSYVDCGRHC